MEHQMKKVDGSSLIVALGPSLIAWLGLKLGISDDIADGKFDDENDGSVLIASPGLGSKLGRALGLSNMREVGAFINRIPVMAPRGAPLFGVNFL